MISALKKFSIWCVPRRWRFAGPGLPSCSQQRYLFSCVAEKSSDMIILRSFTFVFRAIMRLGSACFSALVLISQFSPWWCSWNFLTLDIISVKEANWKTKTSAFGLHSIWYHLPMMIRRQILCGRLRQMWAWEIAGTPAPSPGVQSFSRGRTRNRSLQRRVVISLSGSCKATFALHQILSFSAFCVLWQQDHILQRRLQSLCRSR